MSLKLRDPSTCRYDQISLGEVMLRLDPGEGRIRTARQFNAWEGGGEYNTSRGLRKCFGLKTAVCTALVDNEIGHLIEEPFSASTNQLPLDRMTRTIGRDVRRLLRVPDDEGVQMHAPWVDEELLSAEDREFAEMAPRPFPSVAAPASSSAGVHDGGGGVVLASVAAAGGAGAGGRNDTLTAASAAMQLRSTETLNI